MQGSDSKPRTRWGIFGILVICVLLGFVFFEYSTYRDAQTVGQDIRQHLERSGEAFRGVKLRFAVGGGIIVVQTRPCLSGMVETSEDFEHLQKLIRDTCAEHGWDEKQVRMHVSVKASQD